ncbi:DUF3000 domain-containing protein [Streptacidiphilus sp. PB12-B1b]|uniref:DUF3000 domain-containing protein n=1 Tax=Streptacidiphilus sp. PB12-B1b TaxID=2705012 RepID=UPI0015FE0A16|nr:DUF3000 domain-containing protein [Streptacidiphilus sp. PB12-B1b]QMU78644.1 DUF3000 domain-containing protein [Streptacidiphilus sp. PB12-B1b]
MAAVSGHPASEDGAPGEPSAFREAVEALRATRLRPEVVVADTPAPRRLAPYAFALTASVEVDGEELADGRLVLLHEPGGHEAWQGEFRLVSLGRAQLEPEMAHDPLLSEVGWSWLMDSLAQQGARFGEPSGTVSRCSSQFFGSLAERPATTDIEIRASWTPAVSSAADFAGHLRAWCELLCLCAGLPPFTPGAAMGQTVPLPTRRHPR